MMGIKVSSKIENFQNNSFSSSYYKSLDFGASSIVGYSIHEMVDIAFKYNYGLIDTDKRDYSTNNNRVVNFSVLYSLK